MCLQDRAGHTDEGDAPARGKVTGRTGCSGGGTLKRGVVYGHPEGPEHRAIAGSRCYGGKTGQGGCCLIKKERKKEKNQ